MRVPRIAHGVFRLRPFGILLAIGVAGCSSRGFVRPQGPSAPVAAPTALWERVTSPCRDVRAYQAQLRLSGRVAGRRIPGLTVGLALTEATDVGMEVRVGGPALFVLGGRADRATLVLTQDRRVVTAPAEAIVEALIGVALGPARLLAVLTGCLSPGASVSQAVSYDAGRVIEVRLSGGDRAFVVMTANGSVLRSGIFDQLAVDYTRAPDGWPSLIQIRSGPGRVPAVSLSMRVETMRVGPSLPPALFAVVVPEGAAPLSVEDLRASGPLGAESRAR